MKIFVKVKPGAKVARVERVEESLFNVSVKAPAEGDKANLAVIETLAAYFKVPKNVIHIKSGLRGRNKIIEILN